MTPNLHAADTGVSSLVSVRLMAPAEIWLVRRSWMEAGWRQGRKLRWQEFRALTEPKLDRLLKREETKVAVATGADPDYVLGWLCWADLPLPVVHFAYVKRAFRGVGLLRSLADAAGMGPGSRLLYTAPGKVARALGGLVAESEYLPLEEFLS